MARPLAAPPSVAPPVLWPYGLAALAGGVALVAGLDARHAALAVPFWLLVLVVVRSDIARFRIPDAASAAIAALGLVAAVSEGGLQAVPGTLAQGAGAFAVVWAVRAAYHGASRREGIGFGDVKLAGALGLWLDPAAQAATLQLAALSALALVAAARIAGAPADRTTAVPFGAFLAPAGFAVHIAVVAAPGLLGGSA
jgi:prepilin signal peptidase PulO-like enzyme (type II secretory pathway)